LLGLVHLIDAIAVNVELPPVIDAAQAGLLVASEPQRGPAMRAKLVDEANAALAVTKAYEAFAQQLHPDRRTIRLRQFTR
jgi:hypothetical protein